MSTSKQWTNDETRAAVNAAVELGVSLDAVKAAVQWYPSVANLYILNTYERHLAKAKSLARQCGGARMAEEKAMNGVTDVLW